MERGLFLEQRFAGNRSTDAMALPQVVNTNWERAMQDTANWRVSFIKPRNRGMLGAVGAAVLLGFIHFAGAQEIPAIPIPKQPFAQPVRKFIGQPAIPNTISATPVPQHPYMAPNGLSNIHMDGYMSDTYTSAGPLGHAPTVKSAVLLGLGGTVTFDSAGRIIIMALGNGSRRLLLLDPVTLGIEAAFQLPSPPPAASLPRSVETSFGGGGYYFLDELDRAVLPTADRRIWVVEEVSGPRPRFALADSCDPQVPEDQDIQSVLPDAQGRLWFTTSGTTDANGNATSPAWVGTLVFTSSTECTVKTLQLNPPTTPTYESISKSFAVDPAGGVFIVSDYAMYRFDAASDGTPQITWREAYDRGTPPIKPGQIQVGSGTTPTLMGSDFVTIADNAAPQMHVVVYRRAAQVQGSRLLCAVPVFEPGESATENSLIATNKSIIVENNYGYYGPAATSLGRATEPGISRIDINDDQSGCHAVWTNQERVPSVVSQMSLATGLVYTDTKDPGPGITDAWYLTAIDFATGNTAYKRLGGTGLLYNNHYSAVYLGPDQKTAYVGVVGGIIAIRDRY
jgi:hypothetical protein